MVTGSKFTHEYTNKRILSGERERKLFGGKWIGDEVRMVRWEAVAGDADETKSWTEVCHGRDRVPDFPTDDRPPTTSRDVVHRM